MEQCETEDIPRAKEISVSQFIAWLRRVADQMEKSSNDYPSDWGDKQSLSDWIEELQVM